MDERGTDVAVVGGGLAGLSTAAILARAGRRVVVFEKANLLGGRALTSEERGFHLNLGPHALYRIGAANKLFGELGLKFSAGIPSATGAYALRGGQKFALPGGPVSLITTGLFGLAAKLETARVLATIARGRTDGLEGLTMREWIDKNIRHAEVRELLHALVRVTTYANHAGIMSAGATIHQMALALRGNVFYLDGGWQKLVNGLRDLAQAAGARIVNGRRVAAVTHDTNVRGVQLADGELVAAEAVILAVPPDQVSALTSLADGHPLRQFVRAAIPVRAACLDVALDRLPKPAAKFALGLDQPHYLSVHSAVAKLAPEGKALIQVAKYMGTADEDPRAIERELEASLDLLQPGWRDAVAYRRFLPNMIVTHAVVTAEMGGLAGRPPVDVAGIDGLYLAGDWIGPEGQLADASVASAKAAAQMILASASGLRRAA